MLAPADLFALPVHMPLLLVDRPYQVEGQDFLIANKYALLAYDTRLGKTLVALRAAARLGLTQILVIAPAIACLTWRQEIPKILRGAVTSQGLRDRLPRTHLARGVIHIAVVSYGALSYKRDASVKDLTTGPRWDALILDEAHYLKSTGSNRTRAVYGNRQRKGIAHHCDRVWLLSASPTPNNASELYPHYRVLWPQTLSNSHGRPLTFDEFVDQFCEIEENAYGRVVTGSKNQGLLRAALAPFVSRLRKRDVYAQLPPVTHQMVPLDVNPASVPGGYLTLEDMEHMAATRPDSVSTIRRELGEAKADAVAEWVREQLEGGLARIVLFAWHVGVIHRLRDLLAEYEPVVVSGETTPIARQQAMTRFQTDPACRVFVGQIVAAGIAISLDAADDVAICEPSWVPEQNYQALSRVEHVSKTRPITVSWLYCPGTLDSKIMRSQSRKLRQIAEIWR